MERTEETDKGPQRPTAVPKRFYVTMTWDNWPDGGSYGTVVEAESAEDAELQCRAEMARSRLGEGYETIAEVIDQYGDDWHVVDCWDLDEFIGRHRALDVHMKSRIVIEVAGGVAQLADSQNWPEGLDVFIVDRDEDEGSCVIDGAHCSIAKIEQADAAAVGHTGYYAKAVAEAWAYG